MLSDKHGKLAQAEQFYRRAIDVPGQINEAPLLRRPVANSVEGRKFEEIVKVCENGIKNAPVHEPSPLLQRPRQGPRPARRFPQSEAEAQKALDIAADRDRLFAFHLQVRILTQAEKYATSGGSVQEVPRREFRPGRHAWRFAIAVGRLFAWKKMEACEAQLHEVLKLDPTNATANNDLGYVWADHNKNLKEAEEMIRKAIDLDRRQRKLGAHDDKDNAAYVDSLGWVLFRRGDFDGARKEPRTRRRPARRRRSDIVGPSRRRLRPHGPARAGAVGVRAVGGNSTRRNGHGRRMKRYRDVRRKLDQVKTQVRAK